MMLATRGTVEDLDRASWIVDEKLDGWRCLATRDGDRVRLLSRTGTDLTGMAPGVVAALAALPLERFTLDGELVAYDDAGKVSLSTLLHGRADALVAFDVLQVGDVDARPAPLWQRREVLGQLLGLDELDDSLQLVRSVTVNGAGFYRAIVEAGGEGVVCKRATSTYSAGRSRLWRKFKPHY